MPHHRFLPGGRQRGPGGTRQGGTQRSEARMRISLIVAVGRRNEIGKAGKMPWHLPADLKHFKRNTLGKPVLMGRKTLEAIGRPLPERRNLVLTRDAGFKAVGCETVTSLDAAVQSVAGVPELMVRS